MYTIEAKTLLAGQHEQLTEVYVVLEKIEAERLASELESRKYLVEIKEDFQSEQ